MDHLREIRQLWFIAKYYFEEAMNLKNKRGGFLDMRLTGIMDFFENGIPKEDYQMELSLLVGRLNSAAIRLCTLNEGLQEDGEGETIKNYVNEFRNRREVLLKKGCWKPEFLAEELRRNVGEYLPQILRDGVAHREEAVDKKMDPRWKARHSVIESLKIIEVFFYAQSAIERFGQKLKNLNVL